MKAPELIILQRTFPDNSHALAERNVSENLLNLAGKIDSRRGMTECLPKLATATGRRKEHLKLLSWHFKRQRDAWKDSNLLLKDNL